MPPPGRSWPRLRWLVLLLGAGILVALAPYLPGLLGAAVLTVASAPLHRRLATRLSPAAAAGVVTAAVLVLLLVPGTWLLATAVAEASDALRALQASDIQARIAGLNVGGFDLAASVTGAGTALLTWLSGRAVALFGRATRATLDLVLALFGLYYLLAGGDRLWREACRLVDAPASIVDPLRARFVAVTEAMLFGMLLTALAQGTIVGVTFALLGLRGAVLWGVVTACVSVLPVLGSALVWLPGAAVLAADHRFGGAAIVLAVGAGVVSNIDNLIRLVVLRRLSGIHPMLTLVGAFAGVGVFGLAGVFLGPLLLSYFVELLRIEQGVPPGAHDGPTVHAGDGALRPQPYSVQAADRLPVDGT